MSGRDDAMELRYVISAQPYEAWERDMMVALAEQERDDPTRSAIKPMVHSQSLRWAATLRAVEAERDAYREVCRWWFCGCTQEEARAKFEDWAAIHGLEFKAQWCKAFDTLKALEEARAQR